MSSENEVIVEIAGRRYAVTDPHLAEHIRYFVDHADLLRLGSMRAYRLLITRTRDGNSYVSENDSLPYQRSATAPGRSATSATGC